MAESWLPFAAPFYDLGRTAAGRAVGLSTLDPAVVPAIAATLCRLDPWRRLAVSAAGLERALTGGDDGAHRFAVRLDDAVAGVVVVRHPWLLGPYLALIAVLPDHQRLGLGGCVLAWLEAEARRAGSRNVWLCVSSFNGEAIAFYERSGFHRIAEIEDLVADGLGELLMRRRLV